MLPTSALRTVTGALAGLVLASAAPLAGCADPAERSTDFDYLHATIIEPNCATSGCHSEASAQGGLDLSTPERTCAAVFPPSLITLVRGEGVGDVVQMPPDVPLPEGEIELLEAWVAAGAPCD